MVPRVETSVLGCAGGGHACLGNPLPWLLQGPFSAPRQPFRQKKCLCPPLGTFSWWLSILVRASARWQRWKCRRNALTLISSSQRTRWYIDRQANQLETFCLPLFGGAERHWREFYQAKPRSQTPYSFHFTAARSSAFFISLSEISVWLWLCEMLPCCQFGEEVLTYCSSHDDNQCDYAEGVSECNQWGLLFSVALTVIHLRSAARVWNV